MTVRRARLAVLVAAMLGGTACSYGHRARLEREVRRAAQAATVDRIQRFASEDALRRYIDPFLLKAEADHEGTRGEPGSGRGGPDDSCVNGTFGGLGREGDGLVATHGDHVIVMKRGRLFSIDVANGPPRSVSQVDLDGRHRDRQVTYYEMLLHSGTIVVLGFSSRWGMEIALFDIDAAGLIRPRARYDLRTNAYYSFAKHAARLVGDSLVLFMPDRFYWGRWVVDHVDFERSLPAMRSVRTGVHDGDWREIIRATDVHRPVQMTTNPILYTLVTCDLSAPTFSCSARGILAPIIHGFHVADDAVYVKSHGETGHGGLVYRLPFDGGELSAVGISGSPSDQDSFRVTGDALEVLLHGGAGDPWTRGRHGAIALLHVPLAWFSADRVVTAPPSAYRELPRPAGYPLLSRFVGDTLVYGASSAGWHGRGEAPDQRLFVTNVEDGATTTLRLEHAIDRILPTRDGAVVFGASEDDAQLTSITWTGTPAVSGRHVRERTSPLDTRSRDVYLTAMPDGTEAIALAGARADMAGWGWVDGAGELTFLRVGAGGLSPAGTLQATPRHLDVQCVGDCGPWYGPRPLRHGDRLFGLIDYELVEARLDGGVVFATDRTTVFQ